MERTVVQGDTLRDTLWYTIPDFSFMDQDSQTVTNATYTGQLYVADFFFTSCPSICPKMKEQMLRVLAAYPDNDTVQFLSHSIDTRHDSVPVLKAYSTKLGVGADRWRFVTGEKAHIYGMAKDYFVAAMEDDSAPGGYEHSGYFVLVDRNRYIRGVYDGTDPKAVDRLIREIEILLREYRAV